MHTLGKSLQALGLVIPLAGLFRSLTASDGNARGLAMTELAMLAAGALVFMIGTALVRKAGG